MAVCTGGGGAGVAGGESKLEIEDSLMGFGGGFFCCLSDGGKGGENVGRSGTLAGDGVEMGTDDKEPLELVDGGFDGGFGGGFGGAIGGGFMKVKSSPSMKGPREIGFGLGMDREGRVATFRLFMSPMKSGGGIKVPGGGGGAIAGGGGANMPSSPRSGRDITDRSSHHLCPQLLLLGSTP